ncbi:MAG TPA: hypothetical protein VFT95_09710, partial [Micromonosporaceae bacterium]|nr:hypothetical protein [Micromonosporaceae bacterium]
RVSARHGGVQQPPCHVWAGQGGPMSAGRALTEEQANAVWDVLVERAGASEAGREDFVAVQTRGGCDEYRFIGSLGFGGKFWTATNTSSWYVTCYREDETAARRSAIGVTNAALDGLRASYVALAEALEEK